MPVIESSKHVDTSTPDAIILMADIAMIQSLQQTNTPVCIHLYTSSDSSIQPSASEMNTLTFCAIAARCTCSIKSYEKYQQPISSLILKSHEWFNTYIIISLIYSREKKLKYRYIDIINNPEVSLKYYNLALEVTSSFILSRTAGFNNLTPLRAYASYQWTIARREYSCDLLYELFR